MVQCDLIQVPDVIKEWADYMEMEEGKRPSETSIRIASLAYELGRQMADRGYQDKMSGCDPIPFSSFEAMARSIIVCTNAPAVKMANTVAELLYDNYMIGYTGEKN